MYIQIVLARILGVVLLVTGLSVSSKKSIIAIVKESQQHRAFLWLSGLVALVLGCTLLGLYSTWNSGWYALITLIGWIAVLKGIAILLFPDATIKFYKKFKTEKLLSSAGIVVIILSIVLLWAGFVA
jgi:hypothetical protein